MKTVVSGCVIFDAEQCLCQFVLVVCFFVVYYENCVMLIDDLSASKPPML